MNPPLLRFPRLEPATLLRRRNRFVAEVFLADGSCADAHVANTGRLPELMIAGRECLLRPAAPREGRRTPWSLCLVRSSPPRSRWISLETPLANRLFEAAVGEGRFPELSGERVLRREQTHGSSRFDFLLADGGGRERLVEVKSANLFVGGEALFPDAPTERGRKHLLELARHSRRGNRSALVFVAMGGEAERLRPNVATDPAFASALAEARDAGVMLLAASFRFTPRDARFERLIPVVLAGGGV